MRRTRGRTVIPPQTAVYLEHYAVWGDGWAGPNVELVRSAGGEEDTVVLVGSTEMRYLRSPLELVVFVDEEPVGECAIRVSDFHFEIRLARALAAGSHRIRVRANTWWVPHQLNRCGDYRALSWRPAAGSISFTSSSSQED